jgi:outer membrane translocation and assembly module TamA
VVSGFGEKTNYVVYGGDLTFDLRDEGFPPVGAVFKVAAHRYEDTTTDEFDFDHIVGEVQGHVPLGYRNRRIAVRVRTAHSVGRGGGEVPFYLMETLGGGSTLRGFREYRFRDARNILINAEYRWEVWTYMDFTLFYDAGKVFSDIDQLNFDDLESAYGFGVRMHTPGGFLLRMDLAKSSEGLKFHIGSGPSF